MRRSDKLASSVSAMAMKSATKATGSAEALRDPALRKPAASASAALLNQNSASVASYHCEPGT